MARATFSFPTLIEFGDGALASVPAHVKRLGERAFLVTDPGVRDLPIFDDLTRTLDAAGVPWSVTSAISPNPLAEECEAGGRAYRETAGGVVVGFGGGSALDAAKAIALMATHPGSIADYDAALGGGARITADVPPVICLPTTAGTGSEVSRSTVIMVALEPGAGHDDIHNKIIVFSPHLMPRVAIADPALMVGMPPWLTAATGFDALTHNLEALVARGYHPLAEGLALEGLALTHQHLLTAYRVPGDILAREGMAMAAIMGAAAFQKGLGATHSLAHPLSSLAGMHHGLANAVCLPYVVAFNRDAAADAFDRVATRLGLGADVNTWLLDLRRQMGIPHTLTEAGISPNLLDALADQAFKDICHPGNPRACTHEDLYTLYRQAFDGSLPA